MQTFPVSIQRIRRAAEGILEFTLMDSGRPLPPFTPGSHIDVHLAPGLTRQYSLCNGPGDRDAYTIAVKLEDASRGGSAHFHGPLKVGDILSISEPRNNFELQADSRYSVLLAGGIGVTPLYSMARHLQADRKAFSLHYFMRTLEHAAFRETIRGEGWEGKAHLHPGLDPSSLRQMLSGLLDDRREGTDLYICGPAAFMRMAQQIAEELKWPASSIHVEHFGPVEKPAHSHDTGFEVVLALSGKTLWVPPDRSIAAVVMDAGLDIEVSCEQGLCGACVTRFLGGIPDHRDTYLTEEQHGDQITLCVSRSKSPRLTLRL